ncbi:fatty acid desaturase [Halobacteriovorax sp. GB3]|uniref:acyl-CoA desaturase n=1 Tax=Halobacteriovorax sp. GB3 TaxID=2719615 RepID=UPI00235E3BF3|nr:fatty acid desaturase [Halobacteriovorax sp. GB3]MDD0852859.1 fatty acid desaturase [Halobacteriovorax sp. GB3]
MERYHFKNLSPVNTTFLVSTPLLALGLGGYVLATEGLQWQQLLLAIVYYFITGLSITAGYHRLFSHRAYKASWPVRLFFLIFGAATFQNSALKWSADHRRHHGNVDTEVDPYNINEGFFYAHMGWVLLKENPKYANLYPKDLTSDRLIMWQHKYYLLLCAFFGLILPGLLGALLGSFLYGFAIAGLARVVFVHHATFFINSLCHMVGNQPYSLEHSAKDSWLMAFFTYGEGYHNFHHTFQTDYRNGIRWYHFDPTKWLIYTLSKFNLAKGLKVIAEEDIELAKFRVQMEKLEQLELDQTMIEKAHALFEQIKKNLQDQKRLRRNNEWALKDELLGEMRELSHSFYNMITLAKTACA